MSLTGKIQHNYLHHAYTNIEGYDEDIASRGPIRLSQHAPLKEIQRYQYIHAFFFYGLMTRCILSTVFQMAHVVEETEQPLPKKKGTIESEWVVHELKTTSDFARNDLLLNYYIGGLNFQIEHHLFPNICHIHYRKIAPLWKKRQQILDLLIIWNHMSAG